MHGHRWISGPPAEEPGGRGETQSIFAHRNSFQVEDDDEESDKSEYETGDEDQEEEEDEEMDILARDLDKLKGISSIPDPWISIDPWRKGMIKEEVKVHISEATKKFDEQLAKITKAQIIKSTTAASSQGGMSWISPTMSPTLTHTSISNTSSSSPSSDIAGETGAKHPGRICTWQIGPLLRYSRRDRRKKTG